MELNQVDLLVTRLNHLERQHKRLRLFVSGFVLVTSIVLIVGAGLKHNDDPNAPIGSRAFVVLDDDEKPRGILSFNKEEGPHMSLFNADKKLGIVAELDPKTKDPTISLSGGDPRFVLVDKQGAGSAISITDGRPSIIFSDKNKMIRLKLALDKDGAPEMHFYDETGNDVQIR